MGPYLKKRLVMFFISFLVLLPVVLTYIQSGSQAKPIKADVKIDVNRRLGPVNSNWRALAQGGEERGVRMFQNVISQLREIKPRYIRIDHIYDFYDVVSRDLSGNLVFDWDALDETVCDIFDTGAKPFFVLSYMPPVISADNSVISPPRKWEEWQLVVTRTVERYSGRSTVLCDKIAGNQLADIYYEVWNEPDLDSFGRWSLYFGPRDYKTLYQYAAAGAAGAREVHPFFIGGPATTGPYRNWSHNLTSFAARQNLRLDFISWHKYTKNSDEFKDHGIAVNLPKVISEWGYDSGANLNINNNLLAAHQVATVRTLINTDVRLAFTFEVKDGPQSTWGILRKNGEKKLQYEAFRFLNLLEGERLDLVGEGTYVRAIASTSPNRVMVVLVNYDPENQNAEFVPVSFAGLENGDYQLNLEYLGGPKTTFDNIHVTDGTHGRATLMAPNSVAFLELRKK